MRIQDKRTGYIYDVDKVYYRSDVIEYRAIKPTTLTDGYYPLFNPEDITII